MVFPQLWDCPYKRFFRGLTDQESTASLNGPTCSTLEKMMKTLLIAAFTALVGSSSIASPLEQLRELGELRDELRRDRQADRDASSYERRDERRDYERRGPREYDRRSDPRGYDDDGSRYYDRGSRSREYDRRDYRDYERRREEARERAY